MTARRWRGQPFAAALKRDDRKSLAIESHMPQVMEMASPAPASHRTDWAMKAAGSRSKADRFSFREKRSSLAGCTYSNARMTVAPKRPPQPQGEVCTRSPLDPTPPRPERGLLAPFSGAVTGPSGKRVVPALVQLPNFGAQYPSLRGIKCDRRQAVFGAAANPRARQLLVTLRKFPPALVAAERRRKSAVSPRAR